MNYQGLVISDIHVGAFDLNKLYTEYSDIFINYIENMKQLDYVIIDGDFFDHKFYLNDKSSIMAYKMLTDLFNVCEFLQPKIRIVYGTESHECNQYDVLKVIEKYQDVKIIKKCEEEELFEDFHILYIPEERIYDKSEYYGKFFSKEKYYDYIFGHGVIREIMTNAAVHIDNRQQNKSKKKVLSTPVFSSGELEYCCKGQIFFGHYHVNKNINDKVFYVGSFSRWQFGEDGDKGFYHLQYDSNKYGYTCNFIVNHQAESYVTIGYGYDNKIFENMEEMDKALSKVDELLSRNVINHVRFEFNIPNTIENPESSINYIKDRYKFNDNVKIGIVNGYIEKKKEEKRKEVEKDNKEMEFIIDKNISIEEKLHKFIIIKNNRDIDLEHIIIYVTQPISEIIESIQ